MAEKFCNLVLSISQLAVLQAALDNEIHRVFAYISENPHLSETSIEFKKNQIIEFKLNNGKQVIINYVTKTNEVIVGYDVKFDMGNYVTKKEKILVPYEMIEKYEIIIHDTAKEKIIVICLAAGFIAMIIIAISMGKAMRDWRNTMN